MHALGCMCAKLPILVLQAAPAATASALGHFARGDDAGGTPADLWSRRAFNRMIFRRFVGMQWSDKSVTRGALWLAAGGPASWHRRMVRLSRCRLRRKHRCAPVAARWQ